MVAGPLAPLAHDLSDDLLEPGARAIAPREDLVLAVGVEDRRRRDRLLEVVIQGPELVAEPRAELGSHQAVGRGAQHELLELLVEVLLPRLAPAPDPRLDLGRDDARVALHLLRTQGVRLHLDLL